MPGKNRRPFLSGMNLRDNDGLPFALERASGRRFFEGKKVAAGYHPGILDDFHCIPEKQRVMKNCRNRRPSNEITRVQYIINQVLVGSWHVCWSPILGTPFDLVSKVGFPTQLIH